MIRGKDQNSTQFEKRVVLEEGKSSRLGFHPYSLQKPAFNPLKFNYSKGVEQNLQSMLSPQVQMSRKDKGTSSSLVFAVQQNGIGADQRILRSSMPLAKQGFSSHQRDNAHNHDLKFHLQSEYGILPNAISQSFQSYNNPLQKRFSSRRVEVNNSNHQNQTVDSRKVKLGSGTASTRVDSNPELRSSEFVQSRTGSHITVKKDQKISDFSSRQQKNSSGSSQGFYQGFKLLRHPVSEEESSGMSLRKRQASSTTQQRGSQYINSRVDQNNFPNPFIYDYQHTGQNLTLKNQAKEYDRISGILLDRQRKEYPANLARPKKCNCGSELNGTCYRGILWLKDKFKDPSQIEPSVQKYLHILKSNQVTEANERQIDNDLPRTFPEIEFFKKTSVGYHQLRNVLQAISVYFKDCGYVQGMNFIAASFLYHTDEVYAFWLCVHLIETLAMQDVYLPGKQNPMFGKSLLGLKGQLSRSSRVEKALPNFRTYS